MARFAATIYLLVATVSLSSAATTLSAPTRIKVDADGGYSGIVVKIDKDVPEEECGRILASLKVGLRMNALYPYLVTLSGQISSEKNFSSGSLLSLIDSGPPLRSLLRIWRICVL